MFTLTVFEVLLFQGRSVLWPAERVTGIEKVKKVMVMVSISLRA